MHKKKQKRISLAQVEDVEKIKVGLKEFNIKETIMAKEQNQVIGRLGRALRDYIALILTGNMSNILRLAMTTNNFEIKLALIMMIQIAIQFRGHPNNDPYVHINNFLEICDTLKINKRRQCDLAKAIPFLTMQ